MTKKILRIPEGQEHLPFQNRQASILKYASPFERHALLAIGALMIALAGMYSYWVMASVIHVAHRGETAKKMALMSADVAHLETAYLSVSDSVTEARARELGFVTPMSRSFVERDQMVTLRDAR